jgi:hypothetical protein
VLLALALALPFGGLAADSPDPSPPGDEPVEPEGEVVPPSGELRQAVRSYFRARLRSDLGWTDEQVAEIEPQIQEIERGRADARVARREAMLRLRRAMREGAGDDEISGLLDRLESITVEQREHERIAMRRIDDRLTPRQRVEFRAFVERFRRELRGKVDEIRRNRAGGGAGGPVRPRGGRP